MSNQDQDAIKEAGERNYIEARIDMPKVMNAMRAGDQDTAAAERLESLFLHAFDTNHPAMHDWARIRMQIKRLQRELKDLHDNPREVEIRDGWIPTANAMPEQGKLVEIFGGDRYADTASREWEQGGSPWHFRNVQGDRIELRDVTHWRPATPIPRPKLADLLGEAADNAHAGLAETGISDDRKHYRADLEQRLRDAKRKEQRR